MGVENTKFSEKKKQIKLDRKKLNQTRLFFKRQSLIFAQLS